MVKLVTKRPSRSGDSVNYTQSKCVTGQLWVRIKYENFVPWTAAKERLLKCSKDMSEVSTLVVLDESRKDDTQCWLEDLNSSRVAGVFLVAGR